MSKSYWYSCSCSCSELHWCYIYLLGRKPSYDLASSWLPRFMSVKGTLETMHGKHGHQSVATLTGNYVCIQLWMNTTLKVKDGNI